ncbi:MAG: hypothetical protein ACTHU0_23250, partial [Kofleriaceae bacterium]
EAVARNAAHGGWSVRLAVLRAFLQNPSPPLAAPLRPPTTLRPAELAELASDPALPEALRAHASEVWAASLRRSQA